MKNEEMKDWAMSLRPGDKVVRTNYWVDSPEAVLTVVRITPTGRIVTDQGTYMFREWSGRYVGYGAARNHIIPATPETIAVAEEFQRKEQERIHQQNVIAEAKRIVYNLFYDGMSYDMALKIIALHKEKKKHGEESQTD